MIEAQPPLDFWSRYGTAVNANISDTAAVHRKNCVAQRLNKSDKYNKPGAHFARHRSFDGAAGWNVYVLGGQA